MTMHRNQLKTGVVFICMAVVGLVGSKLLEPLANQTPKPVNATRIIEIRISSGIALLPVEL